MRASAPAQGFSTRALREVAQLHEAVAAVYVGASEKGLEVWVADRLTGKVVLSEVVAPTDGTVSVESLMATRAVELLRASLLELERQPAPASEEATQVSARLNPPERSWWLEPGVGGAVVAVQGLAATMSAWVALQWHPVEHVGVEVTAGLPLVSAQVEAVEGSARLAPWLVGAGARVGWPKLASRWSIALVGGAYLLLLQYEGAAAAPELVGRSGVLATGAPYLGAEVGVRLWSRVALRARGTGAWAFAPMVIRFDGREVATAGHGLFTAALSLSVEL